MSVYSPSALTTYPVALLSKMLTVLEDQLLVNLPREAMEDSDTFRNEHLYTQACDNVLQVSVVDSDWVKARLWEGLVFFSHRHQKTHHFRRALSCVVWWP